MSTKSFQLKVVLVSTVDNKPLSGKTIKFYYRRKDEPTYVPFASDKVTDSNGVAVSDKVQLVDQEYYFKAVFEGDAQYEGTYAEKLYSPSAPSPFNITYMMMIMMIMMIMFLLMTVMEFFRKPEKKKEEEEVVE